MSARLMVSRFVGGAVGGLLLVALLVVLVLLLGEQPRGHEMPRPRLNHQAVDERLRVAGIQAEAMREPGKDGLQRRPPFLLNQSSAAFVTAGA